MKLRLIVTYWLLTVFCTILSAQDRKVQNRPYTDLRQFHFGIQIGTHLQDMEFTNVGPITFTDELGVEHDMYITCDQSRIDPGFNVGVLGEFRLTENFQFRIAPAMYFGSKHIVFHNTDETLEPADQNTTQDLKTVYIATSADLIFAAPRFNNHRAYLMAGICPAFNLTGKSNDILKLKRLQTFLELGIGMDLYLPYFKIRPELKFMLGLGNALDTGHVSELKDINDIACASSVSKGVARMVTLTFYFE